VSVDHLRERWAQPQPAFKVEDAEIRLRIEDLAGRFNLNNLVQEMQPNRAAIAQFQRLLLRLQISEPYAERLVDWLDADQQPTGEQGAEENAYLLLDPPYRSADRRLYDLSELRLLLGMREEDFQRLVPHVSALPPGTPLNVNTAGALVLSTLADGLDARAGEALALARPPSGFTNIQAFRAQPALGAVQLQDADLAVGSQYFQATSEVRLGERRTALVSLLQREQDGSLRVLQRNLGQAPRQPTTTPDGER
jgi:general secretion pathway protein K